MSRIALAVVVTLAWTPTLVATGPTRGEAAAVQPASAEGSEGRALARSSTGAAGAPVRTDAGCLAGRPGDDGPGVVDPFHTPSDQAKRLNADALGAYRLGKWDAARTAYRAAEAADPAFLAPSLNVACSFVRQERLDEALTEVRRLLARAYLPWSEEILTAADLGALKVGAPGQQLRAMLDEARRRWADGLGEDLFFVARMRAPLHLEAAAAGGSASPSEGPRTLVLGPRQEAFAWSPRTGRYRQLTAEQGRVLALGVSRDRRRIAIVTAEKLVIAPGAEPALRGLTIKEVDLGMLAPVGEARATADVQRVEIIPTPGGGFAYRLDGLPGRGPTVIVKDGQLEPSAIPRNTPAICTLTGHGVSPATRPATLPGTCGATAREARAAEGTPEVEVTFARDRKNAPGHHTLSGPFGGGLCGLPIP